MKKILLTLYVLCTFVTVHAQSLIPLPYEKPNSGFELIRAKNPYMIRQQRINDSTWTNLQRFSWAPGPTEQSRAADGIYQWANNNWQTIRLITHSFVLNSNNQYSTVIEKNEFNNQQAKYRYSYNYYTNQSINTIKVEEATAFEGEVYETNYELSIKYNSDGTRQSDSTFYHQFDQSRINYYFYNNNKQLISSVTLEGITGDSLNKVTFGYNGDKLSVVYGVAFNPNTDNWDVSEADSITYTNNQITTRISYGFASVNGGGVAFQPFRNETYTYDASGNLSTFEIRAWQNNAWVNNYLITLTYVDGKPTLGLRRNAINGVYEAIASSRYLFSFPTGLSTLKTQPTIVQLYPNPATQFIQLNEDLVLDKQKVYIINSLGKRTDVTLSSLHHSNQLDISTLPNGMYFIYLESEDGKISSGKFLVNR